MGIKVNSVKRTFKNGKIEVKALKDISFGLDHGTFNVLKGRSGSGKTTLINIIGALDYPTEGNVFINDDDITTLSERQRDKLRREYMGFVFQSVALVSNMTAFENIDFILRIASDMKANERKKRIEECMTLVGLKNKLNMYPHQLSGGEQQRIGIARAIAHRPKLLLADEPTAELDTHTSLQIVKIFKDLIEENKITIIMTTHDPKMMELADNVIELKDGELIYA